MKKILVLNGPNLNLLGTREPEQYGRDTLADVERLCQEAGAKHGVEIECRQSNHEGVLIDWIQEAFQQKAAGLIIKILLAAATIDILTIRDRNAGRSPKKTSAHRSNSRAVQVFSLWLHRFSGFCTKLLFL